MGKEFWGNGLFVWASDGKAGAKAKKQPFCPTIGADPDNLSVAKKKTDRLTFFPLSGSTPIGSSSPFFPEDR
jgi:hypothetical protein